MAASERLRGSLQGSLQTARAGVSSIGRAALSLSLLLAATSCSVSPRAQVLVTVDAEENLRALTGSVRVRMWGRESGSGFDDEVDAEETAPTFPWVVAMFPSGEDVSRGFRFEATAYAGSSPEDGGFLAQARVISGYQSGQVQHIYLLLRDACIGVPCEQLSESCRSGTCEPAAPPTFFDPDDGPPEPEPPPGSDSCDPNRPERCNRMDDNCNGVVDEGFDFVRDPDNCGGCNVSCARPNATGRCELARCTFDCDEGFGDCIDGDEDGCDQSLIDPRHCGACGTACPEAEPLCEMGPDGPECVPTCSGGRTNCDGACVDTQTSTTHCGACGMGCDVAPNMITECVAGECQYRCPPMRLSCDGPLPSESGCERMLGTNTDCTACGDECTGAACLEGICGTMGCSTRPLADGTPCGMACRGDQCRAGLCDQGTMSCDPPDGGPPPDDAGFDAGVPLDDGGMMAPDAGFDAGPTTTDDGGPLVAEGGAEEPPSSPPAM